MQLMQQQQGRVTAAVVAAVVQYLPVCRCPRQLRVRQQQQRQQQQHQLTQQVCAGAVPAEGFCRISGGGGHGVCEQETVPGSPRAMHEQLGSSALYCNTPAAVSAATVAIAPNPKRPHCAQHTRLRCLVHCSIQVPSVRSWLTGPPLVSALVLLSARWVGAHSPQPVSTWTRCLCPMRPCWASRGQASR